MRLSWPTSMEAGDLAPGQVDVWSASLDGLPHGDLAALLSAEERGRAGRFHFERDRLRFVAGRGLLRVLLGRYLDRSPAALRFGYGARGKPFLRGAARLCFNVTHSGGLVVLAFTDRTVGVDVERERPIPEADDIARHTFSPHEAEELKRLPYEERARAFFRCWTRKEAFVKATGDGLSRPLDAFDVSLAPGEPARLLRVEGEPEAAARYWLQDLQPAWGFAGALAIEGRPTRVVQRAWDASAEVRHGSRRDGRQEDLQGGREPRGAVLDLAGGPGEPARLA